MLLDLAPMRGVQVDPERRLADVQGARRGLTWDRETQALTFVAPGGL